MATPPPGNPPPQNSLSGSPLLIIFAKEPRPGEVKTRLCPPLTPEKASQLYRQFLADVLEEMANVPGIKLALAYTPAGARPFFANLGGSLLNLVAQRGADLGERLRQAFQWGFHQGATSVLIRNSDSPDLPGAVIMEAQEVLQCGRAQVALGPCPDGGYYLVGLTSPQPELFHGITWSGPRVLTDSLARAHNQGLAVHLLPPWPDIDTLADLQAFLASPKTSSSPGWRSFNLAKALMGGG